MREGPAQWAGDGCVLLLKVENTILGGLNRLMDHNGKAIQTETPQSVSYKSSKRKKKTNQILNILHVGWGRGRKKKKQKNSENFQHGKCIAWSYPETVSVDTLLTFHTNKHHTQTHTHTPMHRCRHM